MHYLQDKTSLNHTDDILAETRSITVTWDEQDVFAWLCTNLGVEYVQNAFLRLAHSLLRARYFYVWICNRKNHKARRQTLLFYIIDFEEKFHDFSRHCTATYNDVTTFNAKVQLSLVKPRARQLQELQIWQWCMQFNAITTSGRFFSNLQAPTFDVRAMRNRLAPIFPVRQICSWSG